MPGEIREIYSYYSAVMLITWLGLATLCILIWENGRIPAREKWRHCCAYLVIAAASLAEWAGLQLSGRPEVPEALLRAVKCADYILTPLAGGAIITLLRLRNGWNQVMACVLAGNTLLQIVSVFMRWMVDIDAEHNYTPGFLYNWYLAACAAVIVLVIVQFIVYSRSFRQKNLLSLYAIMLLVVTGFLIQEILPGGYRTTYIAMALGAALMFIHYNEFAQASADEIMVEQQLQLNTDALTGLFSRNAYSRALKSLDAAQKLPAHFTAFSIDVNGLKTVNDNLGHEAGDELIRGAAWCIQTVLGGLGRCYRTGGDEFVVLAEIDEKQARLKKETENWQGKTVKSLHLAAGYAPASEHPGLSAEKLVNEADMAMYAAKTAYYQETGLERRAH